jgi:hypothetical protein
MLLKEKGSKLDKILTANHPTTGFKIFGDLDFELVSTHIKIIIKAALKKFLYTNSFYTLDEYFDES